MRRYGTFSMAVLAVLALLGSGSALAENKGEKYPVTFSGDIEPMLQMRCVACHSGEGEGLARSGLNLSSYEGLMKGTKYGPIITAGSAMSSSLMMLVSGKAGIRMPHNQKPLSNCEVQALRTWINKGAKDD